MKDEWKRKMGIRRWPHWLVAVRFSWFVFLLLHLSFILHPSSFILHPFFPDQARIGFRAAWTSSGRLMGKVWGASESRSGGSSVMRNRASEKASSVALVSVSVGSIIIASRRTRGK